MKVIDIFSFWTDLKLTTCSEDVFLSKLMEIILSRVYTGGELLRSDSQTGDTVLKQLWHHSDAILCCSMQTNVILQMLSF